ncbi:MAG TPA: hypothetical protein VFV83_02125 [Chthoniobacteraceae bacterium]|nr:hypothetical protein [Chthoniobacteraceae bacterium]
MIVCLLASGAFAASTPDPSPKAKQATASPSASPAPTASAAQLSPTETSQAIKTDSVTIPTPGELFAALAKPGKPDWASRYRGPIAMNYKTRAQIALNLGGLIADGFIAVEAQDTQQVKNVGGDIVKMAKALGVSESILSRGNSINQFAENDEWATLQEELEATQNEVKASMQSHRDQDLVILVSIGGWIRGTQVVSGVITKSYDEKLGQILRQPELLRFIRSKIDQISPDLQNDPLVKSVNAQLGTMEQIVATPFGQALSAAEVTRLNESVNKMMQEIQRKDQ